MIDHSKFTHALRGRSAKSHIHDGHKWAWSGNMTKFVILHPLIFATVDGTAFKFYTELKRYNHTHIQEPVNSRVVEFCIALTSVTSSHNHFGLYSLTGSTSGYMSMFTLTAI